MTSIEATSKCVAVGCERGLCFYRRAEVFCTFPTQDPVTFLMSFGPVFLSLTTSSSSSTLTVYSLSDLSSSTPAAEVVSTQTFPAPYTSLVHPTGYVNKVILICPSSPPILYNFKTKKVIYTFSNLPPIHSGWPTPAPDCVCFASSGTLTFLNVKLDLKLFSLSHPTAVTSVSFRVDSGVGRFSPCLVTTAEGLTVWDLRTRTITSKRTQGANHHLTSVRGEALAISQGPNVLESLLFDSPTAPPRVLRQRRGHSGPVAAVEGTGDGFVTLGRRLIEVSLKSSALDREWSQGRGVARGAERIGVDEVDLLLPVARGYVSDGAGKVAVTIHHGSPFAYCWSVRDGAQKGPVLRQDGWKVGAMFRGPGPEFEATCVAVSPDGQFACVGTRGGVVFRYNVESGEARGAFPRHYGEAEDDRGSRLAGSIKTTERALLKGTKVGTGSEVQREEEARAKAGADADREARRRMKRHYAPVVRVGVDADQVRMHSVDEDGYVITWEYATRLPASREPGRVQEGGVKCAAFDGGHVAYGCRDGVGVWDLRRGRNVRFMKVRRGGFLRPLPNPPPPFPPSCRETTHNTHMEEAALTPPSLARLQCDEAREVVWGQGGRRIYSCVSLMRTSG